MIVNGKATILIQSWSFNESSINMNPINMSIEYGCDIKTQKCHLTSVHINIRHEKPETDMFPT